MTHLQAYTRDVRRPPGQSANLGFADAGPSTPIADGMVETSRGLPLTETSLLPLTDTDVMGDAPVANDEGYLT